MPSSRERRGPAGPSPVEGARILVLGEPLAVGLELDLGQLLYVGAEEELQQREVAQHVRLGGERAEPVVEGVPGRDSVRV